MHASFSAKICQNDKKSAVGAPIAGFHTFGGPDLPIFYDFRSKDARFFQGPYVMAEAKLVI
ncbi:hypothetical protein IB267_01410 [Ensifer sp. ENS09]|uniref:hypothetical protein n=1 Tax=Ensifer sp. ENS09 TaxID=2769263 RepID=UPI00177EFFC1|nr:hypothetical protein [Ensifer sp. ENS09]MBD9647006.1 hypothetical protein [Ensifer sp. ENS09]